MSETTIKSSDVVVEKTPTSFKDLKKDQLVAAALAFGTESEGNREVILADLHASGVTWEQYAEAFLVAQEDEAGNVEEAVVAADAPENSLPEKAEVATAEKNETLEVSQKYLVKMTRENPYFEFKGYRFTQERPYAIMTADDAQKILSTEDGFRQAFPAELEEFYDRA